MVAEANNAKASVASPMNNSKDNRKLAAAKRHVALARVGVAVGANRAS